MDDETNWGNWWPSDSALVLLSKENKEIFYKYKNYKYKIITNTPTATSMLIEHDGKTALSNFQLIALNRDSTAVIWKGEMPSTNNPVERIKNYLSAVETQRNISKILQSAKIFLEKTENIYGINILQQQVKDTILISTKITCKSSPPTEEIYSLIKSLRAYILANGAVETNFPMLNITKDNSYNVMIAIPINRIIPATGKFVLKRMIPGKILVTEVKGGPYAAEKALRQLTIFMEDNYLTSPAIPFQSLVTERPEEPDTSKWITKIYFPVF